MLHNFKNAIYGNDEGYGLKYINQPFIISLSSSLCLNSQCILFSPICQSIKEITQFINL